MSSTELLAATIPGSIPESDLEPHRVETIIEARPGWRLVDVRELWKYRELLVLLTWRDVAVRYKQTVLGVAWVVLQPLAMMAAFSLFFAKVGDLTERVENYPLFVLSGLLAWSFFGTTFSSAGQSMIGNQSLVTKVYFPRLILPLSAAGVALVDLAVGLGVLAVGMTICGVTPDSAMVMLPLLILLLAVAALGVGIFLAALIVAYRDFRYILPFLMQFWLFCTPVIYMPVDLLGPTSRALLPLNPAYGLILNFRACLLGTTLDWYALIVSSSVALGGFAIGCLYFRRVERTFADII